MKSIILGILIIGLVSPIWATQKISLELPENKIDVASKALRAAFDSYSRNQVSQKNEGDITKLKVYLPNFCEKFIVLEEKEGDFGGYWLTIVIARKKMQFWKVWIFPTNKNSYQIRQIQDIRLSIDEMNQFRILLTEKYNPYWQ